MGVIHYDINRMEWYFKSQRALEMRDQALLLNNLGRINRWSALTAVVMVATGLIQVFMIRRLFKSQEVSSRGGSGGQPTRT